MEDKWSKDNWDQSLEKVKALLAGQCPEANCEVWLVGSALNKTGYVEHISLNVRVEFDYGVEKYHINLEEEAMKHIDSTDDYLLLAAGAALKSLQNLKE